MLIIPENIEELGPITTEAFVEECLEALEKEDDKKKVIILLEECIQKINLFGYGKVRSLLKEKLPEKVEKMWKDSYKNEACHIAKLLFYIILVERSYLDGDESDDAWKQLLKTCKGAKKSPVMALLSVLLNGTSDDHWTSKLLATCSFSAENIEENTEYSQFITLVKEHKEILLHLGSPIATNLLAQVIQYYQGSGDNNYIQTVINEFLGNKELKSHPEFVKLISGFDLSSKKKRKRESAIEENVEPRKKPRLSNLLEIAVNAPEKLAPAVKTLAKEKCLKYLAKLSKNNENGSVIVAKYIIKKIPSSEADKLLEVLMEIANLNNPHPSNLALCAEFIKAISSSPQEREVLSLSLALATTYSIENFNVEETIYLESMLINSIKYAASSLKSDQVAVFSMLFINYLRRVARIAENKEADETTVENLCFHAATLVHLICQKEKFFSRISAFILSEVIQHHHQLSLALFQFHKIVDAPSRALLAVALPPAKKRIYSTMLPQIRQTNRYVA